MNFSCEPLLMFSHNHDRQMPISMWQRWHLLCENVQSLDSDYFSHFCILGARLACFRHENMNLRARLQVKIMFLAMSSPIAELILHSIAIKMEI
jgi:hypothetical protein